MRASVADTLAEVELISVLRDYSILIEYRITVDNIEK